MIRKFIRKLQKMGTHSYVVNVPKSLVDKFGWRERQKLEIVFKVGRHQLAIRDWKKR